MEELNTMRTSTGLRVGSLKVYGTDTCSWTKKQLEYLDQKGEEYSFVNCKTGQCPSFVSAYPTLDLDGKILVGFQEL